MFGPQHRASRFFNNTTHYHTIKAHSIIFFYTHHYKDIKYYIQTKQDCTRHPAHGDRSGVGCCTVEQNGLRFGDPWPWRGFVNLTRTWPGLSLALAPTRGPPFKSHFLCINPLWYSVLKFRIISKHFRWHSWPVYTRKCCGHRSGNFVFAVGLTSFPHIQQFTGAAFGFFRCVGVADFFCALLYLRFGVRPGLALVEEGFTGVDHFPLIVSFFNPIQCMRTFVKWNWDKTARFLGGCCWCFVFSNKDDILPSFPSLVLQTIHEWVEE